MAELEERYKDLTGCERKVMPIFCAMAPVKAPRWWPKSSLSSKSKRMAAWFSLIKGWPLRELALWIV